MNPLSTLLGAVGFRANQSQFAFRVSAEAAPSLVVKSFTGSDHGLSADYLFQVTLCNQGPVWPGEMVGKPAQLELLGSETPVVIHGLISEFTWAGNGADGSEFVASLASPLFPLKLRRNNRVFLNTTVPQIIEEVLGGAELGCDFAWEIQGDYPVREYTVQYHETDWEFITRLAAASGLFFRWESDPEKTRLLFHDGLETLPEIAGGELLYQVQSGTSREGETIFAFNARVRLLSATAELRDYNYRTPEILLDAPAVGASAVPGHGCAYRFGEHHKDLQQGQQVAKLRQQALDWQREIYLADSDCRAATPGGRITMTGHPDAQLNREYLIIQVEHQGDQSAGLSYGGRQTAMTYRNQLTLIPFGTLYTPPLPEQRRMHGILSARVESAGGQYAYLDEQGRYRIRLHFDDGQATPGAASHAVRLGQTYSGENYGLHFPLHPGTEVALTCVNGDLDRPLLLGALPNPETLGPVTAANPSQNILRTFGGNELLLEDRKGQERIELFTRERKNLLNLDAGSAGHKVRLATAEGTMEVQAAKSLHLESGDTHSTTSGNDHLITVENMQQLATKKAGIDLQAATDIRMKATNKVDLHSEQQDIQLKAAQNMVLQAGEGMTVEVRNQNLTLRVTGGQLSIEAAKEINILGQGGGAITIGQSGGKIQIAPSGAVSIDSHTVDITGKSVNIQGLQNAQGGGWSGIAGGSALVTPLPVGWKQAKPDLVIGLFFDGTGNNKDAEPTGRHTNVVKLWDLYSESTTQTKIYIQGVGTKYVNEKMKKSPIGLGLGIGIYCGGERLIDARKIVLRALDAYQVNYGPPQTVIFDVFGFSRGAMLARHFVNMVNAGLPDLQRSPIAGKSPIFPDLRSLDPHQQSPPSTQHQGDDPSFEPPSLQYPCLAANVRVRFLGIFDSVGSFFKTGDANEGYINPALASSSAGFVYHLTARNEIRKNFPLTGICDKNGNCPANFVEEELYGVHTDIGGGYDGEPEVFFLTDELYQPVRQYGGDGEPERTGENDPEWTARMRQKAKQAGCQVRIEGNTACFFEEHPTKPELALVALDAMHAKAVAQGVPLIKVKDVDAIPKDLVDLLARAKVHDHAAFKQLDELYIHTSHRKLLLAHLDKTFGMAPAKDDFRQRYPNRPERAIPGSKNTERTIP
ncbi:MAG: type VI secretion system tip protein TssI/VgrG [Trichloromonadaceae bacterium]